MELSWILGVLAPVSMEALDKMVAESMNDVEVGDDDDDGSDIEDPDLMVRI